MSLVSLSFFRPPVSRDHRNPTNSASVYMYTRNARASQIIYSQLCEKEFRVHDVGLYELILSVQRKKALFWQS